MEPGLAKIIDTVRISWYFESPEADLHIVPTACGIDYANTWSSKQVHWESKSKSPHCSTSDCGCEDRLQLKIGVARVRLPITRYHTRVNQNPKYCDFRPLFKTQDEWTIENHVIEVLGPFWYKTLWMSKRHTVTLHHIITMYNDIFNHMDGVMRALAKKKTHWKGDLFFAVKWAWLKLSRYNAEVTPKMRMLLISVHILDPFWVLQSWRKSVKGMDINPEDETSSTN